METTITKRRYRWHVLLIAAGMLLALLIPSTADASGHGTYGSPCPHWTVDDVLADLDGDWDRDRVSNSDEVFVSGGLNPCVSDSAIFCAASPSYCRDLVRGHDGRLLVVHHTNQTCAGGSWGWHAVNAFPNHDWDRDGVSNHAEAANGANPCVKPCPVAYNVDVALNPWGDWDGDGRSNQSEIRNWTNPCVYNAPIRVHYVTTYVAPATQTQRLPHVGAPTTTYVAPAPTVSPCPAGYPYFHKTNGQCYANPVNTPLGW